MGNQLPLIKSCCSAGGLWSGVRGVLCSIHHAAMQQPPATDRLWLSASLFGTGPGWSLAAGAVRDARWRISSQRKRESCISTPASAPEEGKICQQELGTSDLPPLAATTLGCSWTRESSQILPQTCYQGHSPAIHLRSRCWPSCYTRNKITTITFTQKSKRHVPERWLSWNQMRLVREVEEEPIPPTRLLCLS